MKRGWVETRQGKHGVTYRARYWVAGPDGEPVARSKSFRVADYPSKRDAQAAADRHLAEVLVDTARGTFVAASEMTVRELVDAWLDGRAGAVLPASIRVHRSYARHVPPDLAGRRVQTVTALHVLAALGRLRETGASPSRLAGVYTVLAAAFRAAVDWGIVGRSPMRGVPKPDYEPVAKVPWTVAELAVFLDGSREHRFAVVWRLAALTGMRAGELLALRWSDVDLDGGAIRVERTLTRGESGPSVVGDRPKTRKSRRTLPLPASCVDALRRHREDQRARRRALTTWTIADGDLVFDRGDGGLLGPQTVTDQLHAEAVRLRLPPLRMHGLRHTCATQMLLNGAHPNAVAEVLGDRVDTLMRVYAHVTLDHRRAAIDGLERAVTLTRTDSPSATSHDVSSG